MTACVYMCVEAKGQPKVLFLMHSPFQILRQLSFTSAGKVLKNKLWMKMPQDHITLCSNL